MGQQVVIANFNSVLQLAFGTNILFLLLELKPIVDRNWAKLDSEFERTLRVAWQLALDEPRDDRRFLNLYVKMTAPRVVYIGIEFVVMLFSSLSSLAA